MKKLWAFFHAMQIIESLNQLIMAGLPVNAEIFQKGYHDIVNAKLIPDSVMEKIKAAFSSNKSDKIAQIGVLRMLKSKNKIKKAVFVVGGSIPILLCVLILSLKVFWPRAPQSIKTKIYSLKFMIFWNAPIRALLEMFYPMMC
jgi:hypothetical protein